MMFMLGKKHAYDHVHPRTISLQRSTEAVCSGGSGVQSTEKISIRSGCLVTLTRHTLLQHLQRLFSGCDGRSGGRCRESEAAGCQRKRFSYFLSSVYRHPFSHQSSLPCVWSSCRAHVQHERACRWRNSLLAPTLSLSVWQIHNTCWTAYVCVYLCVSVCHLECKETPLMNLWVCVCSPLPH